MHIAFEHIFGVFQTFKFEPLLTKMKVLILKSLPIYKVTVKLKKNTK